MKVVLGVCLLLVITYASHVESDPGRHVLYSRNRAPAPWVRHSRAPASAEVRFMLALKQRNLDTLDTWFWQAADPQSQHYQEYKTISEITELISASSEDTNQVLDWLNLHGIISDHIKNHGDSFEVKTTVAQAQNLFHTQFFNFYHTKSQQQLIQSHGEYSIPQHLTSVIEMVTGLSSFPIPPKNVHGLSGATPTIGVIPQMLYETYAINQSTSWANQTSQGVIQFYEEFESNDLVQFSQGLGIYLPPIPLDQIIGQSSSHSAFPALEASLDVDLIIGINPNASTWYWTELYPATWVYEFSVHFFATPQVPLVISISYAYPEDDQCGGNFGIGTPNCTRLGVDNQQYVARTNIEFQKIGLRGISILVGSGDHGVDDFRAEFPASSPFVTAVGATQFVNVTNMVDPPEICADANLTCISTGYEQAAEDDVWLFLSGGGFSNISTRPPYQQDVVTAYLNSGISLPPVRYFNASGRAVPDVAAVGQDLIIVCNSTARAVSGTSASTPIFAGIISKLNAEVMASTGKPLGFLNPLLYQMQRVQPNTFRDIVVGDNGFAATEGWDPVTGLGTPNYANMLAYLESPQAARTLSPL